MSDPGRAADAKGIRTDTGISGALVTGRIVTADMTFFIVDETKLDRLSDVSDEVWIFSSVGSAFFSLAIGFFVDQFFADKLSAEGWVISHVVSWVLAALALVFYGLALMNYLRERSLLSKIKANKATTSFPLRLAANQEADAAG